MDLRCRDGWIEVICGCMFAGKTEELIRRVRRLGYAKKKYVVFKPSIDNRYSESEVVSHDKRCLKSINLSHSSEVKQYINKDIDAVIFDEVQLYPRARAAIKFLVSFETVSSFLSIVPLSLKSLSGLVEKNAFE